MWLDDDGDDDTPAGAGLPDPSLRHWKHPSEVAADIAADFAADFPSDIPAGQSTRASPGVTFGGWPIVWPFGVVIGGVSLCSLALVAVVLSGVGDKPMTVNTDQAASLTSSSLTGSGVQNRDEIVDRPTESDQDSLGFNAGPMGSTTTEFAPLNRKSANPSTAASVPLDQAELAEIQVPVEFAEGPGKQLIDGSGLLQENTKPKQRTSPADAAPVLLAEPGHDAAPLGPFIAGDGYLLTTRAVLGQAQTAAITSGDSWIAVQAAIEAVGVVVLIPASGYSLSDLAPEAEQTTALSVGHTVTVAMGEPSVQRIVGKVTELGDRIATDIKFDPSLAGALLLDESGVAIGLITTPSNTQSDTVQAVAISSGPGQQPPASLSSFRIVGVEDLAIEMTSAGLVVEEVPLASPSGELSLSNLFEAGDKIVECKDVPMRSVADVAAVATDFISGAGVTCTIVRQNSIIEVVQDASGQLVATTTDG